MKLSSWHQTLPLMVALLAGTAAAQNITPGEHRPSKISTNPGMAWYRP